MILINALYAHTSVLGYKIACGSAILSLKSKLLAWCGIREFFKPILYMLKLWHPYKSFTINKDHGKQSRT